MCNDFRCGVSPKVPLMYDKMSAEDVVTVLISLKTSSDPYDTKGRTELIRHYTE